MAGRPRKTDSGTNPPIVDIDNEPKPESGNDGEQPSIIDPATLGGITDDGFERDEQGNLVIGASGKPRRKRGRKAGGSFGGNNGSGGKTNARNSQNINRGLETLSQTLIIVHMGLASFTKFDQFALEKPESDALAHSIANVMEQFDWTPDPKFTAIAGLVTTGATIYGPRLYLYKEHLKDKAKENKSKQPPDNVTTMFGLNG